MAGRLSLDICVYTIFATWQRCRDNLIFCLNSRNSSLSRNPRTGGFCLPTCSRSLWAIIHSVRGATWRPEAEPACTYQATLWCCSKQCVVLIQLHHVAHGHTRASRDPRSPEACSPQAVPAQPLHLRGPPQRGHGWRVQDAGPSICKHISELLPRAPTFKRAWFVEALHGHFPNAFP